MNRPPLEVADIIRAVGKTFIKKHRSWLHLKVLSAIESFRTAALGGHRDQCSRCGHTVAVSYSSCILIEARWREPRARVFSCGELRLRKIGAERPFQRGWDGL
jgi:hypothetical protein